MRKKIQVIGRRFDGLEITLKNSDLVIGKNSDLTTGLTDTNQDNPDYNPIVKIKYELGDEK